MCMKLVPASLAAALASNVLPQPVGPYNKTPPARLDTEASFGP